MKKIDLEKAIDSGMTMNQMAEHFNMSRPGVKYWFKKHQLKLKRRNIHRRSWTDDDLRDAVASSFSKAEVVRKLGLKVRPGNYLTIDKYINLLSIDISHFTGRRVHPSRRTKYLSTTKTLDEIMVENSSYSRSSLKKRLLREGIMENVCSECNLEGEWRGKPITMILDHINGINNDHRLSNLRMLCPNCNSQTSTFSGRNKDYTMKIDDDKVSCDECGGPRCKESRSGLCVRCHKKARRQNWPSKRTLKKDIDKMSWRAIGRKYGVSDNAARKWARTYGLIE